MRPAILATMLTSAAIAIALAGFAAMQAANKLYGMFVYLTALLPSY